MPLELVLDECHRQYGATHDEFPQMIVFSWPIPFATRVVSEWLRRAKNALTPEAG